MERSISEDIKINRFQLEKACEVQPELYWHWSNKLTDAKAKVDKYNSQVTYMGAKIAQALRKDPPEGKKSTDKAIAEMVEEHEELSKLIALLNDAKKEKYTYEAAVDSMDNRKRQLDNLVTLYVRNYYAEPNGKYVPSNEGGDAMRAGLNKKEEE